MPVSPATKPRIPGHPGPPLKLNDGMITALALCMRQGNYLITAAHLCHISYDAVNSWLRLGELHLKDGNTDTLFARLVLALKNAEAEAEAEIVKVVRETATKKERNWIAGMTFLERRHPDRWGRRDRLTADIHQTQEIKIVEVEYRLTDAAGAIVEGGCRELLAGPASDGQLESSETALGGDSRLGEASGSRLSLPDKKDGLEAGQVEQVCPVVVDGFSMPKPPSAGAIKAGCEGISLEPEQAT